MSPKFVQTIFEALAALHRERLTILLVEQNLNVTLRNVQRCYVLERGEIVISGRSEDMRNDQHPFAGEDQAGDGVWLRRFNPQDRGSLISRRAT